MVLVAVQERRSSLDNSAHPSPVRRGRSNSGPPRPESPSAMLARQLLSTGLGTGQGSREDTGNSDQQARPSATDKDPDDEEDGKEQPVVMRPVRPSPRVSGRVTRSQATEYDQQTLMPGRSFGPGSSSSAQRGASNQAATPRGGINQGAPTRGGRPQTEFSREGSQQSEFTI